MALIAEYRYLIIRIREKLPDPVNTTAITNVTATPRFRDPKRFPDLLVRRSSPHANIPEIEQENNNSSATHRHSKNNAIFATRWKTSGTDHQKPPTFETSAVH